MMARSGIQGLLTSDPKTLRREQESSECSIWPTVKGAFQKEKKKRQVAELLVHLLVDKTQQPKSLKPGFVPVLGG